VKILLLGLLPIILLSVIMVRESILYYGIGIPVLILCAFVALIPDDVCRETTRGLLPDEILKDAGGVRRHQQSTQKADKAA
jgi:hypothetical protein